MYFVFTIFADGRDIINTHSYHFDYSKLIKYSIWKYREAISAWRNNIESFNTLNVSTSNSSRTSAPGSKMSVLPYVHRILNYMVFRLSCADDFNRSAPHSARPTYTHENPCGIEV